MVGGYHRRLSRLIFSRRSSSTSIAALSARGLAGGKVVEIEIDNGL